MRRHLLTLLALLVLLMQPAALLHGLSHGHGHASGVALAAAATDIGRDTGLDPAVDPAIDDAHGERNGLDCLQCLAFAAIGSAALPEALLLFRLPPLSHAAPGGTARALPGGTGAGYHARGPPVLA
jgi:hypothetical protein